MEKEGRRISAENAGVENAQMDFLAERSDGEIRRGPALLGMVFSTSYLLNGARQSLGHN